MNQSSGIYAITNLVNGKHYVGSAVNLRNRKYQHFSALRNHKHKNQYLQNAFNKYGEDAFRFDVLLDDVPKQSLTRYEDCWIEAIGDYNIKPMASSSLGTKMSDQAKRKLSDINKGKRRGPQSETHKQNMSLALRGKKRQPFSEERKRKTSEGVRRYYENLKNTG